MKKFIYRYEAMSTPCELLFFTKTQSQADSIANTILLETKRLEKKYNYYKEDSIVSQINNRKIVELDNETKSILQRSKKYYQLTEGTFDITIATIKELYRTLNDETIFLEKKQFLQHYIGSKHFNIRHNKITFDNPYTKIDLGGFVKEYAVDKAITILKKNGISSALVNYGGDIYALGRKPDNSKFFIGIKNPHNLQEFSTTVELENEALTTSASYERNYNIGSKIYSHIISIKESKSTPSSVSVISSNCVESGVFSTSLMIDKTLKTKNRVIIL